MTVYKQPLYYEIAFSFVEPKKQVDNFEKLIKKFSKIKVRRLLGVACGPGLQLREVTRRDYEGVGLDSSSQMLRYLEKKAEEEGLRIETVRADMTKFRLKKKADFAFIMMGSLNVESNEKFLSHLDSVASSLKKGGLYFIQNQILDYRNLIRRWKQNWIAKRNGITVKAYYEICPKNIINQTFTEKMTLDVSDKGKRKKFVHKKDLKFVFPQEFKALIKLNGKFDFLGWRKGNCNFWRLDKPLEKCSKNIKDNMVLLRKK